MTKEEHIKNLMKIFGLTYQDAEEAYYIEIGESNGDLIYEDKNEETNEPGSE